MSPRWKLSSFGIHCFYILNKFSVDMPASGKSRLPPSWQFIKKKRHASFSLVLKWQFYLTTKAFQYKSPLIHQVVWESQRPETLGDVFMKYAGWITVQHVRQNLGSSPYVCCYKLLPIFDIKVHQLEVVTALLSEDLERRSAWKCQRLWLRYIVNPYPINWSQPSVH